MKHTTPTPKPKGRMIRSELLARAPGMQLADVRSYALAHPEQAAARFNDLLEKGELSWRDVHNLRDLWRALADVPVQAHVLVHGQARTITTSMFPLLTGGLTIAGLNEAAEGVETIGGQLVQDFDSSKKTVTFAGVLVNAPDNTKRAEGGDFPLIGAGEERYDVLSDPRGLRLQITQEMVEENDIEGVQTRINALGRIPMEIEEEKTLKAVFDFDGSQAAGAVEPAVLHRNKVATSLYVRVNTTLGRLPTDGNEITNNELVDTTDLEAARRRLALMVTDTGRPVAIPVSRMKLVVPDAVQATASVILGSELEIGVRNQVSDWGPRGRYRPALLSSPYVDQYISTTCWLLGDPQRIFRRKRKINMEIVTMAGTDTLQYLRNRVAFESRVAWDFQVGAIDYTGVVRCLAATTRPFDE